MFDLIGAGVSLISGIFGKKSADKESKAARRAANNQKAYAKKVGAAGVKLADKQKKLTNEAYDKQKEAIARSKDAAYQNLAAQNRAERAGIELRWDGAKSAYSINKKSYDLDRASIDLMAKSYIEQSKQDLLQINLDEDENARQLKENIRAAEAENAYKRDAARKTLRKAETDAKDFERAGKSAIATARAAQAASGFDTEGSPAKMKEAYMTEVMIGVARTLHQGDEDFMAHMQQVNENNQYIFNQKEGQAINKMVARINREGVGDRTKLELKGTRISLKGVDLAGEANKLDYEFAQKERNLGLKTSAELYQANRATISANAKNEKEAARMNKENQLTQIAANRSTAKLNAAYGASSAQAEGIRASNAAQARGTQSLIGGLNAGLQGIGQTKFGQNVSKNFSSLAAKGGGGFKLFGS